VLWLQSLEETNIALPVADPWVFFPDYDPRLPAFARISLDLQAPDEFTTLGVMVIPESGPSYMNLMAPLVVNLRTRIGRQIALESGNYSVAVEIPEPLGDPVTEQAEAPAE
jgi:flagellar assembly factor FliW